MSGKTRIIELLKRKLMKADVRHIRTARIKYKTIPWITKETYYGEPISNALAPDIQGSSIELMAVFDAWCAESGVLEGISAIRNGELPALADFIEAQELTNFEEATVLVLYALGRADGAQLDYDASSMFVRCDDGVIFGINSDGTVRSRFDSGALLFVEPIKFLEAERYVRCFDKYFIAMYREAYEKGEGALSALIALRMSSPNFRFKRLFKKKAVHRPLSDKKWAKLERIVFSSIDPVLDLYAALVPRHCTKTDFLAIGGPLTMRKLDPTMDYRQELLNKLLARLIHISTQKEE